MNNFEKTFTLVLTETKISTSLIEFLKIIEKSQSLLISLESRTARDCEKRIEYLITVFTPNSEETIDLIKASYVEKRFDYKIIYSKEKGTHEDLWFPRRKKDLEYVANAVIHFGPDLDIEHPGFRDAEYRERRMMFAELALNYKYGEMIPKVVFTDVENKTWKAVFQGLVSAHRDHACREYLDRFDELTREVDFCQEYVPQLEDISNYLKKKTNFQLWPVAGYLSPKNFLFGLAHRVFFCTQYVRHSIDPAYTPEPDTIHELMGHAPLLADVEFAELSHQIGLSVIGLSDEEAKKLATIYFFTVEFGLLSQNGQLKAYGAGLLSSRAELLHAVSDKANTKEFNTEGIINEECLVTCYQNAYYKIDTFTQAKEKLKEYISKLNRSFLVGYDQETIELTPIIKD